MKPINYLYLSVFALSVLSCKKEKNKDCAFNEANLSGNYKISGIKYKETSTSPAADGSSFYDACELDDVITFNSNNTYSNTDAGTQCDPSNDYDGTWSITNNALIVDGDTISTSDFSCSGFSMIQSDVFETGDQLTITFKKQ
ncbi:MAG TPA: lipocalin family protein [Chitinophagaceae bacterium]|nr:lipocalin family protein [Chitinophagaceae bacterium]